MENDSVKADTAIHTVLQARDRQHFELLLGWFKYLAALQATCFEAWRDESTKWAHPLQREIAIVRFHSERLSQQSRCESSQATDTDKERMQESIHSQLRVSS